MRTLRLSLAGTVTLLLIGASSFVVAAQDGGAVAPGAEIGDATPVEVELVAISEWTSRGDPDNPLLQGNSLEVGPDGNVWVLDARGAFQIIAPDGSFIGSWGEPGSEPGELSFDREIDSLYYGDISFAPDGSFYVAESGNHRVSKFDADHEFVTSWGGKGNGDGQFIDVIGVSVAPNGNVYVIDDERFDVQVFDPDGRFLFAFAGPGDGPEYLKDPGTIDVDIDGTVFVDDWGNHRIVKYSADGDYIGEWGEQGGPDDPYGLFNPHGVDVGPDGRVYVADMRNDRLKVYDRDGTHIATWGGEHGDDLYVDKPVGVAVAVDGSVYFMQYNERSLEKLSVEEVPVVDSAVAAEGSVEGDATGYTAVTGQGPTADEDSTSVESRESDGVSDQSESVGREIGYSTSGTWMSLVQERCSPTTSLDRVNQPNGDYQVRDLGVTCAAPGDDPRFGAPMKLVLNEDCFADGGCVNWGTIEQPGPDGAWSGWFAGTEDPDANTYLTIVMTGSGDYEGLTHVRHATGPFHGPLDHAGVIFEGGPPPLLVMPEPPVIEPPVTE